MTLFETINYAVFLLLAVSIIQGDNVYEGATTSTTPSPSSSNDKCSITVSIMKDYGRVESSNYPKPYPVNCVWTYIIHIGKGYKLKLVINELDIDTEEGDAMIIEPTVGSRVEIENHSKQSPITKENTSEENGPCVIITFMAKDHPNTHRGFSINFERIEEPLTEPSPHETEIPGWIQLYLAGVSAFEFNLIREHFKEALAKITKEYIDKKHMSNENVSAIQNDIIINSMEPCPSSWPWSSSCIQLNFTIKLTDNPFELHSEHLRDVWDLHRTCEEFYELNISEYELPDVQWFMWFWIFMIIFISVVFAFLLVIVVRTKLIHYYFIKLQESRPEPRICPSSSWTNQHISYLFNAENEQRFRFQKAHNQNNSEPSTFSKHNGIDNASYDNDNRSQNSVDDFDSEDDQHIYYSLNYDERLKNKTHS
ncbi:uncharacterized protein LOC135844092 [Planococcus citri]|uniref:uncharacterized protein LOC135844092 n=1 Tax=Planococcus citri TaxID=170843 RepID=UPI0031F8BF0F